MPLDSLTEDDVEEQQVLIIIDARRNDEYEYSHLPGAINIHYVPKSIFSRAKRKRAENSRLQSQSDSAVVAAASHVIDLLPPGLDRRSSILVYCGVGLRSNLLARVLKKKYGFVNVKVLRGALYEWVNKGYPLCDGEDQPLAEECYMVKAQHRAAALVIRKHKTFTTDKQREKKLKLVMDKEAKQKMKNQNNNPEKRVHTPPCHQQAEEEKVL